MPHLRLRPGAARRAAVLCGVAAGAAALAAPAAQGASRAYELVTPADSGAYSASLGGVTGDGRAYWTAGNGTGDPAPDDRQALDIFVAQRGPSGWLSEWVTRDGIAQSNIQRAELGDTRIGAVFSTGAGLDPRDQNYASFFTHGYDAPGDDLYRAVDLEDPELVSAAPGQPTGPSGWILGSGALWVGFASTPDLETTVFGTVDPLLPGDTDGVQDVYLSRAGDLQLISRRVDGSPDNTAAHARLPFDTNDLARSRGVTSRGLRYLSDDGSTVVFHTAAALSPDDEDSSGDVYLWHNGDVSLISDSQRTTPECPNDCATAATFAGMAADGSLIYFATTEQLTDDDSDTGRDVYVFDRDSGDLTLVTGSGDATAAYESAISEDGSTLFFASTERLGDDPPPAGATPVLYRSRGGAIDTVAELAVDDDVRPSRPGSLVADNATGRPLRTTADGSAVAFVSRAALSAADTDGGQPDVYLWQRPGPGVTLVSAGGNAAHPAQLGGVAGLGLSLGEGYHGGRAISSDAKRVFFTTAEALTPDAGDNGRAKVYEWTAAGVTLISPPGADARPARYLDSTPNGDSVFFDTEQTLTAWDTDAGQVDVYVARVGGGFPEPSVGPGAAPPGVGPGQVPDPPSPPTTAPHPEPPAQPGPTAPLTPGPEPQPEPAELELRTKRLRTVGARVVVPVQVTGAGDVRLALRRRGARGKVLARGTSSFDDAGNGRVSMRLNRAGRRVLDDGRRRRLVLRMVFQPADGARSVDRVRVRVRGAGGGER